MLNDANPTSTLRSQAPLKPVGTKELPNLSPSQLIWRRFKRSRIALIGGVILAIFYGCAIFADFFAPYHLDTRFTNQIYAPPNLPRFMDGQGQFHLQPFIVYLSSFIFHL